MNRTEERVLKKQRKRLKKVIPLFAKWEKDGKDWRTIGLLNGYTPEQIQQVDDFLVEYALQKGGVTNG